MALAVSESEHFVCLECCVAPLLQELVEREGIETKCSICNISGVKCTGTASDDFLLAIKSSIRYHFSEWQYHSKLGDGTLEGLFFIEPNPILKINPSQSAVDREDVILSFLDDVNQRQMQVEVFTAYGRDIYNHYPHIAVSEGESAILSNARQALTEKNHFLVEDEYEKKLQPVIAAISSTVKAGTRWHRARLGATQAAANFTDMGRRQPSYFYEGHRDKSIGAPPVGASSAGRVNRPGVSYLYLASTLETAAAEIRPHPGEFVSLGCFDVTKDLNIVDLTTNHITKLWRTDEELEMLELVVAMEKIFSTAAPPSNRSAYTVTQFLGELFRRVGFDGVKFRSTVETGQNLVLFDPAHASWVSEASKVVEVKSVKYAIDPVQLYDEASEYDIDHKRNTKRGY